jgi:5-methylcytosine-specific restriction endonuclease McrA
MAEGFIVLGTVVDHIVPVTGPDDPKFYDAGNHQLLCHHCHNVKRQREQQQGRR